MSYQGYAISLLGVPYGYWNGEAIPRDDSSPFYAVNGPPPPRAQLTNGVSCAGYLNLIRRFLGKPVPGVDDPAETFPGSTIAWGKFLTPHFTDYDSSADYEDGTLLFRPYKDREDQGHIALILGGKAYHSYAYVWEPLGSSGTADPGVSHTPPLANYYVYAVPPSAWL
jgi:hypothetical protein